MILVYGVKIFITRNGRCLCTRHLCVIQPLDVNTHLTKPLTSTRLTSLPCLALPRLALFRVDRAAHCIHRILTFCNLTQPLCRILRLPPQTNIPSHCSLRLENIQNCRQRHGIRLTDPACARSCLSPQWPCERLSPCKWQRETKVALFHH